MTDRCSRLASFEVPGVDGARFIASRVPWELSLQRVKVFDAEDRPVVSELPPAGAFSVGCDPRVRPLAG